MPAGGDKKPEDSKQKSTTEEGGTPVLGVVAGSLSGPTAHLAGADPTAWLAGIGTGMVVWFGSWIGMTTGFAPAPGDAT